MNNKYVVEYKRKIDNKNMSIKFGPEINSWNNSLCLFSPLLHEEDLKGWVSTGYTSKWQLNRGIHLEDGVGV